MRRLILLLILALTFIFPLTAYADSGGQGTLIGWSFHPPEVPGADPGIAFSYLTSDGSPLVTLVPLVPAFGMEHWEDPDWTKRDALAPLKEYEKQYGQGSLRDLFGTDGIVTFSPEVIYAMKAQGFEPSAFGGPPLKTSKIVSTTYDTTDSRAKIQEEWPAEFTVEGVAGPIVGLTKGEGDPGIAGKAGPPDPNVKPSSEEKRPAPLTPELAGMKTASYIPKNDIHPLQLPLSKKLNYPFWDPRGWSVIGKVAGVTVLLFLLYCAYVVIEDRTYLWRYRRKQMKLEKRKKVHGQLRKLTSLILIFGLASSVMPQPVLAADHTTFDSNMQRTRMITDNAFNDPIYSDKPVYIPIPGKKSYTNPVVSNGVMYQYSYDDQGYGYLYAFDATKTPPVDQNGDPSPQIWNAPPAPGWSFNNPAKFNAGFSPYGDSQKNNAAGVAGPTVANGYVAIGCGDKLYVWPEGGVPDANGLFPGEIIYKIYPNRKDQPNRQYPDEVSSSPVITPPLGTVNPVPWVAVGSWSGGFVCGPTWLPNGTDPDTVSFKYYTANLTPDSDSIITSSPAWNQFNGTILFGVEADYPNDTPRMVSFDPTTGQFYEFGMGDIMYGISSSPAVAGDGFFYVPDKFGGIYKFSALAPFNFVTSNTSFVPQYPSSGNLTIANICVDETLNAIWVIEESYTKLAVLDKDTLSTLTTFGPDKLGTSLGAVTTIASNSSPSGGYSVFNGLKDGQTYIYSNFQFKRSSNSISYEPISANVPPFASVVPDFGPNRWIVCWTNQNTVDNSPAIQLLVPTSYKIKAYFTQDTTTYTPVTQVLPNANVTLVGNPLPPGVTGIVDFQNSDGSPLNVWGSNFVTSTAGLQEVSTNPETWTVNLTAPSQPGTYTVTVTGYTDALGSSPRGSTTATLEVLDTIRNGNTIKSNSDYLRVTSYGIPVNYVPSFPPPNTLDPRPGPDFTGDQYGFGNMHDSTVQTKLGDTIACKFYVPVDELKNKAISDMGKTPKGDFVGARWGQWYVEWTKYGPQLKMVSGTGTPTLQHPRGQVSQGPDYTTIIDYPTDKMFIQNGGSGDMVATLQFKENWEGYKPRGPYVRGTDPANGQGTQYLQYPITGYSVTAHAWVSVMWVWEPSEGFPQYTIYSFDLYDNVPLTVTGTSIWIVPTLGGTDIWSF